jgi:hypothetical protein
MESAICILVHALVLKCRSVPGNVIWVGISVVDSSANWHMFSPSFIRPTARSWNSFDYRFEFPIDPPHSRKSVDNMAVSV